MQPMPAMTKEMMMAGPACSAAATPVSTKMPVPMMPPMPNAISAGMPSARTNPSEEASFLYSAIGLVANIPLKCMSCTERGPWVIALYTLTPPSQAYVDGLHGRRETHREIQIALRYFHVPGLGDQRAADRNQKHEREDLDGRVPFDEAAYPGSSRHHERHRDHDGCDHHLDVLREADRAEHRVDREDDVEEANLQDDEPESARRSRLARRDVTLQGLADFHRAHHDEEHAAPG